MNTVGGLTPEMEPPSGGFRVKLVILQNKQRVWPHQTLQRENSIICSVSQVHRATYPFGKDITDLLICFLLFCQPLGINSGVVLSHVKRLREINWGQLWTSTTQMLLSKYQALGESDQVSPLRDVAINVLWNYTLYDMVRTWESIELDCF